MAISFDKPVPRWVTWWLAFMVILVTTMIIVGGATRLTNSGLSITEWAPITGALPPLTQADWLVEFERYKQIPEFEAEHPNMDLHGFKFIYFWEWTHRELGRIIGLAFALPLFILTLQRKLPTERGVMLWGILILIGIQGAIGWWMVRSGFQEGMVAVSQYRLAVHLGMAFIILGLVLWMFIEARHGWNRISRAKRGWLPPFFLGLVYIQIMAGAFVAGTESGKTYNMWPLMDGDFVPAAYWIQSPFWRNLFENPAAIQFNHRMLAYIIIVLFAVIAWRYRKSLVMQLPLFILGVCLIWQVGLGIWTLLAVAPLNLSLLHQFSSILLFLVSVWLMSRWKSIR